MFMLVLCYFHVPVSTDAHVHTHGQRCVCVYARSMFMSYVMLMSTLPTGAWREAQAGEWRGKGGEGGAGRGADRAEPSDHSLPLAQSADFTSLHLKDYQAPLNLRLTLAEPIYEPSHPR